MENWRLYYQGRYGKDWYVRIRSVMVWYGKVWYSMVWYSKVWYVVLWYVKVPAGG